MFVFSNGERGIDLKGIVNPRQCEARVRLVVLKHCFCSSTLALEVPLSTKAARSRRSFPHATDGSSPMKMDTTEKTNEDDKSSGSLLRDETYERQSTVPTDQESMDGKLCHRIFPSGFRKELGAIFSLAWPAMMACLSFLMFGPISLMFCGHLGRKELAGVALAISMLNITGLSVCTGLSTACDTLFSQAFGGDNRRMVGIYLQRSVTVISLSCCICWCVHLNAEHLLILAGQNPEIAKIAGEYLLYLAPGLIFNFVFQVLEKYLQNQNMVWPTVVIGAVGNGFNAITQYVAVYVLDGGTRASAMGQALSYFVLFILTVAYIVISGSYKDTWGGPSWRALEDWGNFLKLAIAGVIMVCLEWWIFETGIFMNGILGEVELGATSVIVQIEQLVYVIPLGIGVAASIRVGQSLGAGDANAAKTAARVSQVFSWVLYLAIATVILSMYKVLPLIFTNDRNISELTSSLLQIFVIYVLLDSISAVTQGALRGCGRQFVGASVNTMGYLLIAIPVAVLLLFVVKVGGTGFWWAMIIGATPSTCAYLTIMWRTDWDKQVQDVTDRMCAEGVQMKPTPTDKSPLLSRELSNGFELEDTNNLPINENMTTKHTESIDTPMTTSHKRYLVFKRGVACLMVIGLLTAAVMLRLFLDKPNHSLLTVSSTNYTTVSPGSVMQESV